MHEEMCKEYHDAVKIKYPKSDFISFDRMIARELQHLAFYADLESYLVEKSDKKSDSNTRYLQQHVCSGYAYRPVFQHGLGEKVSTVNSGKMVKELIEPKVYTGANPCEHFWKSMQDICKKADELLEELSEKIDKKSIPSTYSNTCWICNTQIMFQFKEDYFVWRKSKKTEENSEMAKGYKVLDHNHITSQFRGFAHSYCNFQLRKSLQIPVLFHNLSSYDSHFLLQALGNENHVSFECEDADESAMYDNDDIDDISAEEVNTVSDSESDCDSDSDCIENTEETTNKKVANDVSCDDKVKVKDVKIIAKSSEKVMKITVTFRNINHKIVLLDSLNFLNASLEKLTNNLFNKCKAKSGNVDIYFPNTHDYFRTNFPALKSDDFELLLRKGVFPYSYFTDESVLDETALPAKEKFYDILTNEDISDEDYNHAKLIWRRFQCKTFKDYYNLYNCIDVSLLADIFETFRSESYKHYGLDPVFFSSAPGLSWAACLFKTGTKVELMKDPDMNLFIDSSMYGGVSFARNPYLASSRDINDSEKSEVSENNLLSDDSCNQPRNHLLLLDCNNQYGEAMSQKLPIGGFKWLTKNEISALGNIADIDAESDCSYMFEVDLKYPQSLHDLHDQYPLAPSHFEITESDLSPFQRNMAETYGIKIKSKKLCLSLYDKKKYRCHLKNLQQYISLGLEIEKIHKVLKFNQAAWIKPYIDLNTGLRQIATSKAEEVNILKVFFFDLHND